MDTKETWRKFVAFWISFVHNKQAKAKFDLFGIVFMAIAIIGGNMFGGMLAGIVGFAGGIIGALISGFVIYVLYTLITGGRIQIVSGLIFAVCVWFANLASGMVSGTIGIGGGLVVLLLQVIFLSVIWGYVGGKRKGSPKAPISI